MSMNSQAIDLTRGIPPPPHPPPPGPGHEQWPGWADWEQHCRLVQQHTRLNDLSRFVAPMINYYYDLDETRLGSINLPDLDFPVSPDLVNYSYDQVHGYLKEFYNKTLQVALPPSRNDKNEHRVRQTTLGRYLDLYRPLQVLASTSTIRLLEILPSVAESEPVSTRLFIADLDATNHPYEAISYTWGEQSGHGLKYSIHVNGHKQTVTPNLHSVLSSLRHPHHSRTVWVDSICINQADIQERCQQVMLMARIYAEASRVLVYLGPSVPSLATLFGMMQFLADNTPDDTEGDDDDDDSSDPAFWKMCHDAGPDLVEGFIELCTRSWWSRMWVLQEYTLNKRDPVFHCGRLKVDNQVLFKNFSRLYQWVEHRRRHPTPLWDDCSHPACDRSYMPDSHRSTEQPLTPKAKGKQKQGATRKTDVKDDPRDGRRLLPPQRSPGREWTIWGRRVWRANHVMIGRNHCSPYSMPFYATLGLQAQCTVPHDAVYGLRELMDPLFQSLFPPDYMMPISTLYARLAAYLLIVDMNVDIFWYFPHRLRDRTRSDPRFEIRTNSQAIAPSWVPDFTRPRVIRHGDEMPHPHKPKPELWPHAAHILDRVLFMSGLLLDEIVEAFPLPASDPFLLLQQLWFVERSYMDPRYLQDRVTDEHGELKDGFKDMLDRLGGVTAYPSIAWATDDENQDKTGISIVDILKGLTNLGPLLQVSLESYGAKIPQVIDIIIDKERRSNETARQAHLDQGEGLGRDDTAAPDLARNMDALDLTSDGSNDAYNPDREDRIWEMRKRFHKAMRYFVKEPTWKDFVGACTFDYDNLRAQVLHRLYTMSAQRVADTLGDGPAHARLKQGLGPRHQTSECAATHSPIMYGEYLEAIESGACDPLEVHLREGFVVDLATKIHEVMADMVGLGGDAVFRSVDPRDSLPDEEEAREESRRLICMAPLPGFSDSGQGRQGDGEDDDDDAHQEHLSSLGLPHCEKGHPSGVLIRWHPPPRKIKYDVHLALQDVVDFLAGREFFLTQTGLVGLTGVGTSGVQDGDDLFLLEGMSHPLIGRLEPSPELGMPKKRRRDMPTKMMKREIVGMAVVRGIDPKEGRLEEATMPSWFEPIDSGPGGLFRFG